LIPVLEGRWIGTDAFAVITQRIGDPSLAQMLEKGERFSNPRAAAILREVNGLLEWAREQKVVHRNVTPDRLYLEPKTDRVRVSFEVAPIPRIQASGKADADSRTIGRLAMTMLTGRTDPESSDDESLGALRPDLPAQLLQATADLLGGRTSGTDVAAYIALVGMADPLFVGESEAERIRAEILEEQRVEREKLASERAAFERSMEEERQKLALEREELQRATSEQREELRRKAAEERAALVARRDELEREASDRRAELERAAEEDRQRLVALRAAIERAGELELERKRVTALDDISDADSTLDQGELATPPLALPVNAPLRPLTFEPLAFEPLVPHAAAPESTIEGNDERRSRRKWLLSGALGAAAIAVIAVVVLWGRPTTATLRAKPATSPIVGTAPITAPVVAPSPADSAPSVASMDSSTARSTPSPDSSGATAPIVRRRPRAVVRDTSVPRDSGPSRDILSRVPGASPSSPAPPAPRDSVTRPDSTVVPPRIHLPDR
jgi:Skp family chaperone for outer membrane proteins